MPAPTTLDRISWEPEDQQRQAALKPRRPSEEQQEDPAWRLL